jgi:hypothetical protein
MGNKRIANELVKIAKSLTASVSNIAEIKAILPEMRNKLEELKRVRDEAQRMAAKLEADATKGVSSMTKELSEKIVDVLIDYFRKAGIEVHESSVSGGVVEVLVGDGPVSVLVEISLMFNTGRLQKQHYTLKNRATSTVSRGELSDNNTIQELLRVVEQANKSGFFTIRRGGGPDKNRSETALKVSWVLNTAIGRVKGEFGQEKANINSRGTTVTAAYQSNNLPKEGAAGVGERNYQNMVDAELKLFKKIVWKLLMPYTDAIKNVQYSVGDKGWIYVGVELK